MRKLYKLVGHVTPNAHVRFEYDGLGYLSKVVLVSYHSVILECDTMQGPDVWIKVVTPVNYSRTTARHVNWFTTNFFGKNLYHELKETPVGGFLPLNNKAVCMMDTVNYYNRHAKKFR